MPIFTGTVFYCLQGSEWFVIDQEELPILNQQRVTINANQSRGYMMKIGFIGTSVMGTGMIANLLKAGNQVQVYNRTKAHAPVSYTHLTLPTKA